MKRTKKSEQLFNRSVIELCKFAVKKGYTFEMRTGYFKFWVFDLHMDYNGKNTVWLEMAGDKWIECDHISTVMYYARKNT